MLLVTAARKGEAFYVATGMTVSMSQVEEKLSRSAFACEYADSKWPRPPQLLAARCAEARTIAAFGTASDGRLFVGEHSTALTVTRLFG